MVHKVHVVSKLCNKFNKVYNNKIPCYICGILARRQYLASATIEAESSVIRSATDRVNTHAHYAPRKPTQFAREAFAQLQSVSVALLNRFNDYSIMIFTCLFFLSGFVRRIVGQTHPIQPMLQDRAEESRPSVLEDTVEENVGTIYGIHNI